MNKQTCIFCNIVAPTISNSVSYLEVFDNEFCKVILDAKPITRGHIIIIAKFHEAKLHRLPEYMYHEMFRVAKILTYQLPNVLLGVTATNLVVNDGRDSGQHIPHAHIHIIPRKEKDFVSFYWRILTRYINPLSRLNRQQDLSRIHRELVNSKTVFGHSSPAE